jgi:hypothetical protein
MSAVEKFPILLSEAEEESSAVPPCFSDEGINVLFPTFLPSSHYINFTLSSDSLLCSVRAD